MHHGSASDWAQLIQALVARDLVERIGLPGREAARRLGIAPSAVSQYLSGRRRSPWLARYGGDRAVRAVARRIAREIARDSVDPRIAQRKILTGASQALAGIQSGGPPGPTLPTSFPRLGPGLARQFHRRIEAEQQAVAACMKLAQKARDELTRAVFRQIASDSLRHAEIVASLASSLDSGVTDAYASGITRTDVQRLIARERAAEEGSRAHVTRDLGGVLGLLAQSMEADERKHEELLQGLIRSGLPRVGAGVRARSSGTSGR